MPAPESSGKLDSADTNPLPNVSSAKAWSMETRSSVKRPSSPAFPVLPKATPIIREKPRMPSRHIRADGTEEIRVEDIMIVVPAPPARAANVRPRANSTGEIDAGDILSSESAAAEIHVEVEEPVFRPPSYSIHATQEILADDVVEVRTVQPPPQVAPNPFLAAPAPAPQGREEAPSAPPPPWTIDTQSNPMDEFEFPTQLPVMSGPYPAFSSGPRLTNFSATEVFRRRRHGMKVVIASVTFAAALTAVAGAARLSPVLGNGGPVGISIHKPKALEKSMRTRDRIVGVASRSVVAVTVSIDDLR